MSPIPNHVEYEVRAGYMNIVADDGAHFAAYGAQPRLGQRFPAVVLLHDWWGLNDAARMLATKIAQAGFHVIAPDLFDGRHASNAREAAALVEDIARKRRFRLVMEALDALQHNNRSTHRAAVMGIGLGGSMAFRAAIQYPHREAAAIAFNGFPQTYMGQFATCAVPILGVYGSSDALIPAVMIDQLRAELAAAQLGEHHRVVMIEGAGHDLFTDNPTAAQQEHASTAVAHALAFLNTHLK